MPDSTQESASAGVRNLCLYSSFPRHVFSFCCVLSNNSPFPLFYLGMFVAHGSVINGPVKELI